MSGSDSQIPLQGRPIDIAGEQLKWMKPQTEFLNQQQTQVQTGLIGQQTTGLGIGNELARANADISLPILGRIKDRVTNPNGMIGGEYGGQGAGINIPEFGVGMVPLAVAQGIAASPDKSKAAMEALAFKKTNIAQSVNGTLDNNGNVDPVLWQRMLDDQVRSGWMSPEQYKQLSGHPEYGKTLANSMVPTEQQPYFKGAQTAATSAAATPYTPYKINVPTPGGGTQERVVPLSHVLGEGGTQAEAPAGFDPNDPRNQAALSSIKDPAMRRAALASAAANNVSLPVLVATGHKESGWNPNAPRGTSGEWGPLQVMPATGASMGFDEKQLSTPLQNVMAGGQYLRQKLDESKGDVVAAAGGYNTGTVGRAVPAYVKDWQQYYNGFGPIPRPAPGAVAPLPGVATGPVELTPQQQRAADVDKKQIDEDASVNSANVQAGLNATRSGVTLREFRDTAAGAPTGSFADQRLALQAAAAQTGSPFLQKLSSYLTDIKGEPGVTQMEIIKKLALNNVVSQEQGIPGARVGAMLTNFFAKASPNINMRPTSVADMVNMGIVTNQLATDFADASNNYFNSSRDSHLSALEQGRYQRYQTMSKFEGDWLSPKSIHGPDVYTAAINLLNNTPVQKAFGSLTPEQRNEAVAIIGRAAPGAQAELMARPDIQAWRASLAAPRK